jgi:hypothetical protein
VASEKYLALVGVSEEDTAHLRLLLRAAAAQLQDRWRWGTEDNADLVIVDPSDLAGGIARNRAFSSGRRCALMSETEELRPGEVRLAKPLRADIIVSLLNTSSATAVSRSDDVNRFANDFYDIDNFSPSFELENDDAATARTHQREENPAPGLDELLKPDTEAMKPQFAVPIKLDSDTQVSYGGLSSARSQNRVADSIKGFGKGADKPEGINLGSRGGESETGTFPLRDYLEKNILGGPATVSIEGAPPLTLDPKEKHFAAPGKLRDLAPYSQREFSRSAFRPVTTQELARLRAENGTHPYSRLIWFDVLTRSGGRLARHLDPGGRFRLKGHPVTEPDFPRHIGIVAALQQPAKLNEIAAHAHVSMSDVFDVVNAYDAIGLIEVERRLPRHSEPQQPTGLLARLRKPFGRS